jgi:hypothetical protein
VRVVVACGQPACGSCSTAQYGQHTLCIDRACGQRGRTVARCERCACVWMFGCCHRGWGSDGTSSERDGGCRGDSG